MNPIEERIAKALGEACPEEGGMTQSRAERIAELCGIKGLTPEDVLQGLTPAGIAAVWMHRRMSGKAIQSQGKDGTHYPLLPFSRLIHESIRQSEEAPGTWTFPVLLRTKDSEIDAERLSSALEQAIGNHPVFSMHITEDGEQWYEKGYRTPYLQAKVESKEGYVYLSLALNRILGDATSFVLFAQNIWRAYRRENLPKDTYLQYLVKHAESRETEEYHQHGEWLAQRYARPDYPLLPRQDSPAGELSPGSHYTPHVLHPDYADRLQALSRRERITPNAFFCLVTALAIMDFNGTDQAGLTWAYMGRETHEQMFIFGSLHRDIPMTITKTETGDVPLPASLFAQLREQMEQGIIHSDYPFTLSSPSDCPWHTAVNVLVQPSLAEAMEGSPAEFEFIPTAGAEESHCMLDIDINLEPLTLTFNYSPRHYTQESIRRFAGLIDHNARLLLNPYNNK